MRALWDLGTYHQVQGVPLALKPIITTSMGFPLPTSFHVSLQLNRLRKVTQIHCGFSLPPLIPVGPHFPAKHGINVHFSNKETLMHPLIWPKSHSGSPGLELSSMRFKLSVFPLNLMIPSNQQQQPHCEKSCKLTRAAHIETFPASAVSDHFSHISDIPGHTSWCTSH